jgi:hypothetical protein
LRAINGFRTREPKSVGNRNSRRKIQTKNATRNLIRAFGTSSERIYSREKKEQNLVCNGTNKVKIKTIHGQFDFRLQKYLVQGKSCNYFDLTSQLIRENISEGLQELVGYYSNRLSYQEVEDLVARISGEKLLSDQKIWEIVVNKAQEISRKWLSEIESNEPEIAIAATVDIYDSCTKEILLFDDGIGVKKQEETRSKKTDKVMTESKSPEQKQKRKTVITDVVLLQTPKGSFEYLTNPIDAQGQPVISLEEMIKYKLKSYYKNSDKPLPIVAITDGASSIRKRLQSPSHQGITLILDWYHLCKKLREFLSMISRNKAEKIDHSKFLFFHLWRGKINEVLTYLKTEIKARNQEKLSELITYITKHESEIINYELRRQTGKTIGSGRMEKGVDLVIGNRQKHKAMSWSCLGSRALAILKVTEYNGQWRQSWLTPMEA